MKIERMNEMTARVNLSRSTIYSRIKSGLWCPQISLGGRAAGFIMSETNKILSLYAIGVSEEEIKKEVKRIVDERKVTFE